jgi:4-hydroxy-3-methylbut-2-enyl diphosphate reductase
VGLKILVAGHSGFCFGVKRAVKLTEEKLSSVKNGRIYSLGALIHNNWVVSKLSEKGLEVIKDLDNVGRNACVILPSHGVSPEKIRKYKNLKLVDTTCPFVFRAQELVKTLIAEGYEILILGDKNHPEIKGLVGISGGKAKVIEGARDAAGFVPSKPKIALISQTTQSMENFSAAAAALAEKNRRTQNIEHYLQGCQGPAGGGKRIASKVDLMLCDRREEQRQYQAACKRLFQDNQDPSR